MKIAEIDPSRLYAPLLNTGLQQKDQPLYQVIRDLIGNVVSINNKIAPSSGGSSTTILQTNITQYLGLSDGDSGNGEIGPPGIPGPAGANGSQGPMGSMGAILFSSDGEDGDVFPPIVGPQGNPGSTGAQGIQGIAGIGIPGYDGESGEDGLSFILSFISQGSLNGLFFWDGARLGIGAAPTAKLDITTNTGAIPSGAGALIRVLAADGVQTIAVIDCIAQSGVMQFRRANGVAGALSGLLAGQQIGVFVAAGYGTTAYGGTRAAVKFLATENWSDTAQGTSVTFNTTLNGAATAGGTARCTIDNNGNFGIGVTSPLALLHLAAGIATAGFAPLKFTSGTVLTSPEAGAVEFNADTYFATITGGGIPSRKGILLDDGSRLTSGKVPVATTNGRLIDSTTALLLGSGIAAVVASTFEKAETGSDANVLTYTTGGTDEGLNVQVAIDVASITGTSVVATVTWKDSNNLTNSVNLTVSVASDGNINIPINAKASNNVVVSTVFVGASTAYNISAFILRLK